MFFHHGFRLCQAFSGRNTFKINSDNGVETDVLRSSAVLIRYLMLPAILMLGIQSSSAFAQSDDEAAAIKIGDSDFIPTVRFDYLQTDNAFLTDTEQIEATAFVIKPSAVWKADRRLLGVTGIYEGEYASYSKTELNYADHSLRAIVNADISTRQRILARFAFDFGHQPLGTSFTRGIADTDSSQVEFINTVLAGSYTYGARAARGNFTVGLSLNSRSYQNREELTDGFGYTAVRPSGQLSLRLSADTRAIATVRFSSVAFDDSARDRNDISLLAGLRFAATGKLGGEFQLGTSLTDFSNNNSQDLTSFVAEAELFYVPSVFSRFELSAARELDNDADNPLASSGVLNITDSAKLNWRHEWSSRLYHVANLSYRLENGDCPDKNSLAIGSGGIEMNLVLRRWLHVGASFSGQSRENTLCEIVESIESQNIGVHIRATL